MTALAFPSVRVEGDALTRGRQYGEQARSRVRRSIETYEKVFRHYADWDWSKVTAEAMTFDAAIADYEPRFAEELRGIALGAGVEYQDILAINVRTEVMFAGKVRQAARGECSALAVLPEASDEHHTIVAQNWDWLTHSAETVVVLEARQEEGPDFVTVVEAGLLAKTGMNSSGIGLVTNALVTDEDEGKPGVPYHVILRAILDAETMTDALEAVQRAPRASSANYIVGHRDGVAVNIEALPGDFSRVLLMFPPRGVITHTNHFVSPAFTLRDVSLWAMPDSPFRLERLRRLIETERSVSLGRIQGVFTDHSNYPLGVCCHPDERLGEYDQSTTVASVIMDLDTQRMWLAEGSPCTVVYRELDYSEFLSKPSRVQVGRIL